MLEVGRLLRFHQLQDVSFPPSCPFSEVLTTTTTFHRIEVSFDLGWGQSKLVHLPRGASMKRS